MRKHFIVGHRVSATVPQESAEGMADFIAARKEIKSVKKLRRNQHVVEMTEAQARELGEKRPDLIVEENRPLDLYAMPGLPPRVPGGAAHDLTATVVDEVSKKPIGDVTVYCAGTGVMYQGVTNEKGKAVVKVLEDGVGAIIASPRKNYWSRVVSGMTIAADNSSQVTIGLTPLNPDAGYSWAQTALDLPAIHKRYTGRGVRIAVIDSGIAEHPDLKVAGGYNTIDNERTSTWNVDEKGHGTHCAGIVAAQKNREGLIGVAPGADLFSIKIFPGGKTADLIEAIHWCTDNYIDVISLSLGSREPSFQVEQALNEAVGRGIICVAAAGNDASSVSYPAAFDATIAVSAIGAIGGFPQDSAHARTRGIETSADGAFFAASFTNRGPHIELCAPGVAIVSSVPGGYAAKDGTSMACPFVAGLAALILEAYPELRTCDRRQVETVRRYLQTSAIDLGLPAEFQGAGLPNAAGALAEAWFRDEGIESATASRKAQLGREMDILKAQLAAVENALAQIEGLYVLK
jgi:hypothetical protein